MVVFFTVAVAEAMVVAGLLISSVKWAWNMATLSQFVIIIMTNTINQVQFWFFMALQAELFSELFK